MEDVDMDPETKQPPMNMRELMKKKKGVKGRGNGKNKGPSQTRNASSSAAEDRWTRSLELRME
jgi:hypothetical protein